MVCYAFAWNFVRKIEWLKQVIKTFLLQFLLQFSLLRVVRKWGEKTRKYENIRKISKKLLLFFTFIDNLNVVHISGCHFSWVQKIL